MAQDNKQESKKDGRALIAEPAAHREAEAKPGMELICEAFETGGSVVGVVRGQDTKHTRVEIAEIGREWLILNHRIDLAKGTWQHVAADYPAIGAEPDFDAQYRPSQKVADPAAEAKLKGIASQFVALLPPEARGVVEKLMHTVSGRGNDIPGGTVYARWVGRGKLDADYFTAGTREHVRGATTGTEGFFAAKTVEKYHARSKAQGVPYFVEL